MNVEDERTLKIMEAAQKMIRTVYGIDRRIGMCAAGSILVSLAKIEGVTPQQTHEMINKIWESVNTAPFINPDTGRIV